MPVSVCALLPMPCFIMFLIYVVWARTSDTLRAVPGHDRGAVSHELAGGLSFGAVLLYVLSYALGAGPVPWVYLPEVGLLLCVVTRGALVIPHAS